MTKYTVEKPFKGKDGKAWDVGDAYVGHDEAEIRKQVDSGNLKPDTSHDKDAKDTKDAKSDKDEATLLKEAEARQKAFTAKQEKLAAEQAALTAEQAKLAEKQQKLNEAQLKLTAEQWELTPDQQDAASDSATRKEISRQLKATALYTDTNMAPMQEKRHVMYLISQADGFNRASAVHNLP